MKISRREWLRNAVGVAAVAAVPGPLLGCDRGSAESGTPPPVPGPEDEGRLLSWVEVLRREGFADPTTPLGPAAIRVGLLAAGTPYEPQTLEAYLEDGGDPLAREPLTLHLDRFDCVTLVESCLAVARVARTPGSPAWSDFAREVERMRYRGGQRAGYASRLHYFSEWIDDNARRGLVHPLGQELGGRTDRRPLRFMSTHPDAYAALASLDALDQIRAAERRLDDAPRWIVPPELIPTVSPRIESGDILAFATSIDALDVTHTAFAYREGGGVLRVLHAPLSGGVVEVTDSTLPEYVAAIRRCTGILLARPL